MTVSLKANADVEGGFDDPISLNGASKSSVVTKTPYNLGWVV